MKTFPIDQSAAVARPGIIFIISAPSGAGKTTLVGLLRNRFPDLGYSVSYTTRAPRPGEIHGVDYFFCDTDEFRKGVEQGAWAEWAVVHDHYYGTSAEFLAHCICAGQDLILEIDVQGARQIMEKFPEAVSLFIMPPSLEVLRERMRQRGLDSAAVIEKRMRNAELEVAQKHHYAHIIVNDRLEDAAAQLLALVATMRGSGT